jgi:hypothetical protein
MGNIDSTQYLRKCEYCKGKDGNLKDIYETFQSAVDTVKHIEESRGIFLSIYKCPQNNGWHLTKNNANSEFVERKETLFQNNNIPLKSTNGTWEYIEDEIEGIIDENNGEKIFVQNKIIQKEIPIVKIESISETELKISGKIIEYHKNVDIEKIFKINLQNLFCANIVKNILDGIIHQITIFVENNNKMESYTILLMEKLLKGNKIIKGNRITINIIGKSINSINMWCCNNVLEINF